jgi:restriction endonuclease Mrr
MPKTPLAALNALPKVLNITSPPREARDWLVEVAVTEAWFVSRQEAEAHAEAVVERFLLLLRREYNKAFEAGRIQYFAFNSSSDTMIQGASFVEPTDSDDLKRAKQRRAPLSDYVAALRDLHPNEFEDLCRSLLATIGVEEATVTRRSGDEGIDFFGRWIVGGQLKPVYELSGAHRLLAVWMVGQAKRFDATQAATPDIRELVGAITLARAHAYSSGKDTYPRLRLRPCDPVFYLFFTSGTISAPTWKLLEASGVIGLDGWMVAALLADHGVAIREDAFDRETFSAWIGAGSSN